MDIMQFAEKVKDRIIGNIDGVTDISIRPTLKNNSVTLISLVFVDEKSNITPQIHLNPFYEQYEDNGDLDVVSEQIIEIYQASRFKSPIDFSFFRDWEQIKSLVAFKVINTAKNKELLAQIPHQEVMDLSMVFYITLKEGTILIYNSHLDLWGIGLEELIYTAKENTPTLRPMKFQSMGKHMFSVMDLEPDEDLDALIEMYVLSNASGVFGAATMFYPDCMEQIANQLDCNFYLLPSSIHETIILPENGEHKVADLVEMVRQVNATVLKEEEILGENVYLYNRDLRKMEIVA